MRTVGTPPGCPRRDIFPLCVTAREKVFSPLKDDFLFDCESLRWEYARIGTIVWRDPDAPRGSCSDANGKEPVMGTVRQGAIAILSSLLLVNTGCGRRRLQERMIERAIEHQTGQKANVRLDDDNGTVTMNTPEGQLSVTTGKSATIPDSFPKDVFLYPGASVLQTMVVPQGYQLVLSTADDSSQVAERYRKEMTSQGWTSQLEMTHSDQTILGYEKKGRSAMVTLAREKEGNTQIILTAMAREKPGPSPHASAHLAGDTTSEEK